MAGLIKRFSLAKFHLARLNAWISNLSGFIELNIPAEISPWINFIPPPEKSMLA